MVVVRVAVARSVVVVIVCHGAQPSVPMSRTLLQLGESTNEQGTREFLCAHPAHELAAETFLLRRGLGGDGVEHVAPDEHAAVRYAGWQSGLLRSGEFFSKPVEQVVAQSVVLKQGFTLREWSGAVATYGVKTEAWHCGTAEGQADYTNFLARAKVALQNTNQLLVINFSRKSLGQAGTGHFSPIGAYNEQANKFLVLDVALFKYPAFWVDGKALWDSLATVDSVSKKNRGFVVITSDVK